MKIIFLASSSKGNCCIVNSGGQSLMIDCGMKRKNLLTALGQAQAVHGVNPESIKHLLITHEHSDHVEGMGIVFEKWKPEIISTHGTMLSLLETKDKKGQLIKRTINNRESFGIGQFSVEALPLPHDARDPVGYIVDDGTHRFAFLADMGYCSEYVASRLVDLDAIAIECNYNLDILNARMDIPEFVKTRNASLTGHTSDVMAKATAMKAYEQSDKFLTIFLHHLSGSSITPNLALAAMDEIPSDDSRVFIVGGEMVYASL